MSIQVALHHRTEYHYDRAVTLLPQVIRLRPAPHCRTPILSYSLKVQPGKQFFNWQQDPYSNYLARLVFPDPTRDLVVEVDLVAEMVAINPFDFFIEEYATTYPFRYQDAIAVELHPYLEIKEAGPKLTALVGEMRRDKMQMNDFLVEVNHRLHKEIRYIIRMEPGVQTCEESLTKRRGSCRDSAWLLVQLLRHLGLAARFVSGYLIQLTADVAALDGPSGPDRDFTDLHAWAEVFLPGAGWIGLDPTSGLLAGEGHIPLACTADPQTAAPISGSFTFDKKSETDEVGADFHFAMSVRRIIETPRVTKPYTDEQWQAIDRLGQAVDADLAAHDVRLTMGGEPTFVGIDDRDDPQWNTTAFGETKRLRADMLLRRLRDRFAPGGLLHLGQGKWYPGESLPRWAYGCWWRKDGIALWTEPHLVAEDGRDYGYGPDDAQAFISDLAKRLAVDPAHAIAGFEDTWYYLWKERRLPGNVNPLKNNLDDAEERARLAKVFEQGLRTPVGYALPLRRSVGEPGASATGVGWQSGAWLLRQEHMFLLPGDSPMGYRLPLDSLPWEAPGERDVVIETDPWQERGPLPTKAQMFQRYVRRGDRRGSDTGLAERDLYDSTIRTALCVEPRGGRLYVFMPPQRDAEDYIDLVAAVEATAKALHMPVMIEGYAPPFDPRLQHFKVTPDPGVIEVNVHPAVTWSELVHNTTTLYEEARQSRLCAEKFMLDGRHSGTGGGNHIVLGGPTPADSPILRRPDLLRSLIGYWHNHPSLSYLFSGLFLGPTSQAPRVDEARNDSLHELDLAFQQIPEPISDCKLQIADLSRQSAICNLQSAIPPWLVDRIFRNLLIDVTGNTHRAEWCIDKLYSPDSASGRLGLVEFRAFEMPPHPRMSLVQQLLMRGLVARFWNEPYRDKLVRWGTQLHDRWMLPHFIAQDFRDVLEELRGAGYAFRDEWFAPHHEFRFPLLGSITRDGVHLELRQAIEPWHVLGEETVAGGTARYVDSSLERVEVKVRGLVDPRHVITCNGRAVPLHPTGVVGEYVAGVRYRAWQPPSCLHPTIPAHAPLVFDLFDRWMQRSLGGCVYHVAHPGGLSYDTFPVNANEAEGRRISRFLAIGHTPGAMPAPAAEVHPEMPLTLDLRHAPPATGPLVEAGRDTPRGDSDIMNGTAPARKRLSAT
ncbi:MAG: transglutaminase family protein [Planctomycetes bacterium]|nr:transglutaminase family protein [Planctomycetota bacterium]